MVSLQPFRASYYDPSHTADMGAVVTAPFDVVSTSQQAGYYAHHPHNFIRIDYGHHTPDDTAEHNAYTRAAATLEQWFADGILTTAPAPGFYLHTQQFTLNGQPKTRTDLFVLCEAVPFEDQLVLPHEYTLDAPKKDRLALMQATAASLSPVFALYSDHEDFLAGYFEEVQEQAPLLHFSDEEGFTHQVWQDDDPERTARISAWFRGRQLYIADGHHRYESALNYRHWQTQQAVQHPAGNFLLMHLSNIYDPGLCVLPTHRLLKKTVPLPPLAEVVARLQRYFTVEALPGDALFKHLAAADDNLTALAIDYDGHSLLLSRPKGLPDGFANTRSMSYRQLDVTVLHELVLQELLGFAQEWAKDPDYILFSPDPAQIRSWLREGVGHAGLYLNATAVRELCGVAMAGEIMPPKSTYFYPKVPSGMLFARLSDAF